MTEVRAAGQLRKMHTNLLAPVEYQLPLGEARVAMNPLIGEHLVLDFLIFCDGCMQLAL